MNPILPISLASAFLLFPVSAQPTDPDPSPLQLQWKNRALTSSNWSTDEISAGVEFIALRVLGDNSKFAGSYIDIAGTVWIDEAFFVAHGGAEVFGNYDLGAFRQGSGPASWDLSNMGCFKVGGDGAATQVTTGLQWMPMSVIEESRIHKMIVETGAHTDFDPQHVPLRSQPLPGSASGTTSRVWNLEYEFPSTAAQSYWRGMRADGLDATTLSLSTLIKQIMLDTSPSTLDRGFFTTATWGEIIDNYDVTVDFQVIAMKGNETDTPASGSNPDGFSGDWTATSMSTQLPRSFFAFNQWLDLPFAASFGEPTELWDVETELVSAGETVLINVLNLRNDCQVKIKRNGVLMNAGLELTAGGTLTQAAWTVPADAVRGEQIELVGFAGPDGGGVMMFNPIPQQYVRNYIVQD